MSPEEKDAIGIRTMRSRKNLVEHLSFLKAEARHLGKRMASLSMLLCDEPARVVFEDAKFTGVYLPSPAPQTTLPPDIFKVADLDGNAIATLVNEIRATSKEIEILEAEIKGMGLQ
jgi:hypothetical protein